MRHFKEWDDQDSFPDRFEKLLLNHKLDQEEIAKHKKISLQIESVHPSFEGVKLSLSEVGAMKIICDAYFIRNFSEMAKQRAAKESIAKTSHEDT